MKGLFNSFIVFIICGMIENVAMIIGICYVACFFEKWSLLWFLLIPALNSISIKHRSDDNNG